MNLQELLTGAKTSLQDMLGVQKPNLQEMIMPNSTLPMYTKSVSDTIKATSDNYLRQQGIKQGVLANFPQAWKETTENVFSKIGMSSEQQKQRLEANKLALLNKGYSEKDALLGSWVKEYGADIGSVAGPMKMVGKSVTKLPKVDEDIFLEFIDTVRSKKIPSVELETNARYLAEGLGVNPEMSNKRLANALVKKVESLNIDNVFSANEVKRFKSLLKQKNIPDEQIDDIVRIAQSKPIKPSPLKKYSSASEALNDKNYINRLKSAKSNKLVKTESVSLDSLKPADEYRFKNITNKDVSLSKGQPMVVVKTENGNLVVDGHHRLRDAIKSGKDNVSVQFISKKEALKRYGNEIPDLKNKLSPLKSDPLIQEAKKYKSAEEFVNSKIIEKNKNNVIRLVSDRELNELNKTGILPLNKDGELNAVSIGGYESSKKLGAFSKSKNNIIVFNDNIIKGLRPGDINKSYTILDRPISKNEIKEVITKSQLLEIWNKANKKLKSGK